MGIDQRFIDCLFDPSDLVEVRMIRPGAEVISKFSKAGEIVSHVPLMYKKNREGANIYIGANPRSRRGKNAQAVKFARCVFVDLDNCTLEEGLARIHESGFPPPTCIVDSGHGVHAYWRLREPINDPALWTSIQKRMIIHFRSDKKIHDPPRIMRVPGFVNHKPPVVESKLIEGNPDHRYDLEELVALLPLVSLADETEILSSSDAENVIFSKIDLDLPASHLACAGSAGSDGSAGSAGSVSPEEIIQMTLPMRFGQREDCLMRLARGLKFEAGLGDIELIQLKPFVRRWHELALPAISTKPFTETWSAFIRAWDRAAVPLFDNPVEAAIGYARRALVENTLPLCADDYDEERVKLLVGVCAHLAKLMPNRKFFLSSHDCEKFGIPAKTAWSKLKMLCVEGVLKKKHSGNEYRAARFQWVAGELE